MLTGSWQANDKAVVPYVQDGSVLIIGNGLLSRRRIPLNEKDPLPEADRGPEDIGGPAIEEQYDVLSNLESRKSGQCAIACR